MLYIHHCSIGYVYLGRPPQRVQVQGLSEFLSRGHWDQEQWPHALLTTAGETFRHFKIHYCFTKLNSAFVLYLLSGWSIFLLLRCRLLAWLAWWHQSIHQYQTSPLLMELLKPPRRTSCEKGRRTGVIKRGMPKVRVCVPPKCIALLELFKGLNEISIHVGEGCIFPFKLQWRKYNMYVYS